MPPLALDLWQHLENEMLMHTAAWSGVQDQDYGESSNQMETYSWHVSNS